MAFTWRINIRKNPEPGGPAVFEFDDAAPQVEIGDQVFWSNGDGRAHWPALDSNREFFMTNQIAADSTSPAFAPGTTGTINYICWLHPGEAGVITVCDAPDATPTPDPETETE